MELVSELLGLEAERLGIGQMILRGAIVYVIALAFVRFGEKRFLGKNTAFDVVLAIMFGSVMSRAITTASDFVPIVAAAGLLVGLHWLAAAIAYRSDRLGVLLKGRERRLVVDGEIQWDEMGAAHITQRDLLGALRSQGGLDEVGRVRLAHLERSGDISVLERQADPRVVEIKVADGVQTVRVELVA